jgi:membrane protein
MHNKESSVIQLNLSRYNRFGLLQLGLAAGCVIAMLSFYNGFKNSSHDILEAQTQKLGRSITALAAQNAAMFLILNQSDGLDPLVANLAADQFVFDATVYDRWGQPLAQSENALPLHQLLPLAESPKIPEASVGRRLYVSPIRDLNGQVIGYFRITLEEHALLLDAFDSLHGTQTTLSLMILITFLIGFLLTRSLSAKRRWASHFRMKRIENKT